jgi:cell division protein FtsL
MGWNLSTIIIESAKRITDEEEFIRKLGFNKVSFLKTHTFEKCVTPKDNHISIGYFNNNIVICIDYDFSWKSFQKSLSYFEKTLGLLYPKSEIITAMCVSSVNAHAYSIIKNMQKIRYKIIDPDNIKTQFGNLVLEEELIYSKAKKINDEFVWAEDGIEYRENQLLEDFIFNIIKRRIGVRIDSNESELLQIEKFNTYKIADAIPDTNKSYITTSVEVQQRDSFPKRLAKAFLYAMIIIVLLNIIVMIAKYFK